MSFDQKQLAWKKMNGENLNSPILEAVEEKIISEQRFTKNLKICIGTDSQCKGSIIDFATVIVFIREKQGGSMFVLHDQMNNNIPIKERLNIEIAKSVGIAYTIAPVLEKYKINVEVHADINTDPKYKSNVAFQDAMGYIKGMGYEFKAKPFSFASSSCANKMV